MVGEENAFKAILKSKVFAEAAITLQVWVAVKRESPNLHNIRSYLKKSSVIIPTLFGESDPFPLLVVIFYGNTEDTNRQYRGQQDCTRVAYLQDVACTYIQSRISGHGTYTVGIVRYCTVLYGIVRYYMVLYGIIWYYTVLYGIVRYHLVYVVTAIMLEQRGYHGISIYLSGNRLLCL